MTRGLWVFKVLSLEHVRMNVSTNNYFYFFRYDKLIIDDNVYIYNDVEKRIERLPYSVSASAGLCLDDEVNRADFFRVFFCQVVAALVFVDFHLSILSVINIFVLL